MKTLCTLGAALAVFGTGLICGQLMRWIGASDLTVPNSPGSPAESQMKATGRRNGFSTSRGKEGSGDFVTRLNVLVNTSNPYKRRRAIAGIADELDARKIHEALAALETRSVRDATEIRLQLFARWAELEPEAALQYAETLHGNEAHDAITAVIRSWAAMNAKAAEEGVARMPENSAKEIAQAGLLNALAENDPRRAFARLQRVASSDIEALFKNWVEKDPTEAATYAAQLPAGSDRSRALCAVAQQWAKTDRDAALAWVQSLPSATSPGVTIESRDPRPLAAIVQTWMNEDAGAAMEWLEQLPEDAMKTDVLAALSNSLIYQEPQRAAEIAAMMPAGKAQDAALDNLIGEWSNKDFAGALAWAQQQPDENVRQILLPRLVDDLMWRDTSAALQLALSVGGDAGTESVADVLRVWTQEEPASAAEWASTQPENAKYLASVAGAWAEKDPDRALEWVRTIPAGAEQDAALASGVQIITQSARPQAAAEWIADIASEKIRTDAYEELAFWWLFVDRKKARDWIKTAPLPAKTKADFLK